MVAENVSELRVRGFEVTWPKFPMREDWRVLRTENRLANESFYGHRSAEEFIRGDHDVPFHLLWGHSLRAGGFGANGSMGHKGADALCLKESSIAVENQGD
jgi:hypothetical protein